MADGGFVMVPRDVLHNTRLSAHARLVWIVLQDHASGAEGCWPSLDTLAEETGLSRPTVKTCIDCLVAAGLLSREHTAHSNYYRVHSQAVLPCEPNTVKIFDAATVNDVDSDQEHSKDSCPHSKAVLLRTVKNLYSNKNHRTITSEQDPEDVYVAEVVAHFQQHIHSDARLTAKARPKIRARLREFTVAQIKQAIDHFAADHWQMHESGNSRRGLAWWFHSEERIERYMQLVPRAGPGGGGGGGGGTNGTISKQAFTPEDVRTWAAYGVETEPLP